MYVASPTWIEFGPAPAGGRGLGAWQLSSDYCASGWSLLNPVAWLGGCAAADAANAYQYLQYGNVPDPHSLPLPPAPNAPQTAQQAANWTPEQAGLTQDQWQKFSDSQRQVILDAIANGSYNPAGNFNLNAIDLKKFWDDYGTPLMIGGAVLVGLIAWRVVKG